MRYLGFLDEARSDHFSSLAGCECSQESCPKWGKANHSPRHSRHPTSSVHASDARRTGVNRQGASADSRQELASRSSRRDAGKALDHWIGLCDWGFVRDRVVDLSVHMDGRIAGNEQKTPFQPRIPPLLRCFHPFPGPNQENCHLSWKNRPTRQFQLTRWLCNLLG